MRYHLKLQYLHSYCLNQYPIFRRLWFVNGTYRTFLIIRKVHSKAIFNQVLLSFFQRLKNSLFKKEASFTFFIDVFIDEVVTTIADILRKSQRFLSIYQKSDFILPGFLL